ncbi:hypothetical protein GCM10008090_01730 [Arenicella chitinivorans]|uniref:YdhG-like domain-containing protein n=1 Tax=Arenicella chitinivorans TaxID=1329800 RepID=A0A918RJB5_9GAMM|nr:DUF1801 domain-containing protein [Arenicella chitinivorans]GGZ97110.1 hypothetical protein GCM10008090_01730 [Arenicella chitinivorans]
MTKKISLKTAKNEASVADFIASLHPESVRQAAQTLDALFRGATGAKPKMWGGSIIGYGEYTYYRANGDEGQFMASGFAMRKSGPVLYIMPGYQNYADLMSKLGPHKLGKSCLYLKHLNDIDLDVVAILVKRGLADLANSHEVRL